MQIAENEWWTLCVPKNLAKYHGNVHKRGKGFQVQIVHGDTRICKTLPTYDLACVYVRMMNAVHSLPVRNVVRRFADRLEVMVSNNCRFIVDLDDADIVEEHVWWTNGSGYVETHTKGKTVKLHRLLTNAPDGKFVDHRDGNTLNNRRQNLRICTNAENNHNQKISACNKSGYKGVHQRKSGRYRAVIRHNNRLIHLGTYDTAYDAAIAYNARAIELFGEFACLNYARPPVLIEEFVRG